MTLVSASSTLAASAVEQGNSCRRLFVASTGRLIAILEDASHVLSYKTSAPGGGSWSSPAALFGASGNAYGALIYLDGSDTLYVFFMHAGTLNLAVIPFSTGGNTFGSVTTHASILSTGIFFPAVSVDAVWDSVQSVFYVAIAQSNALTCYRITPAGVNQGGVQLGSFATEADGRVRGVGVVPGSTSTITVLYQDGSPTGPLYLYTGAATISTLGFGSRETVSSAAVSFAALAMDMAGHPDILYVDAANKIQATKQTGTGIYSVPVNVGAAVNPSYPSLSLATDGANGLYCFFSSVANQPNAEIYVAQRSGTWGLPAFFAGGDASGYEIPRSAPVTNGGTVDVLWQKGTIAPFSVYYGPLPIGSAPSTPVWLGPTSFETSLTPLASFLYQNPDALDLQAAAEYQYKEGATIVGDSGEIATDATTNVYGVGWNPLDPDYFAPATLVFGHTYTGSVRTKDSVLGLWSGWSTPVSFTPVHGGTVTLTDVTDNGVSTGSSPVTLTTPIVDSVTASWVQGDGHNADAYRDTIWNSAIDTIIDRTGITTIGGALASGSSFTSTTWTIAHLINSTTYKLIRSYRDQTTQLWSDSAPWEVDTAWTPPDPVTDLTATPDDDGGTVALSWVNPMTDFTAIEVAESPHGLNDWQILPLFADLPTHETVYPCPFQSMDYRVRTVDALGIYSADTIVTKTMGARGSNRYAIWITSLTLPTQLSVALGGKDSSNATTGLKWDNEEDVVETVYNGNRYPTTEWGLTDFKTIDLDFDIPPAYALKSGGLGTALADAAGLETMWRRREPILYRDMDGFQRICEMRKFERERDRVGMVTVRFTLRECQAFVTPLVSP